jgi:hypothetical protein
MDLIQADHENEAAGILSYHDLDDDKYWLPLGGIENNLSIAGNQQSSSTAALVEKLINCIDSLLILECLLRGIAPESSAAPSSMVSASSEFVGVPEGGIAALKPPDRAKLAEMVQLVATGSRTEPCYTIIDQGEGQRPCDFPSTLCSLVKTNKLRIRFVQGKFNMGGSGVLAFCGQRNLQLILSRRNPRLVEGGDTLAESGWGWTVIRRREPDGGRKSSHYEYLSPGHGVPCFEGKALPVRPTRDSAFGGLLEWGCLVKLYNYQSEFPSAVTLDLNYELSRRLYQIPLPIRLYERRTGYAGHSLGTILTGMSVRIADDRSKAIEEGFPDSGIVHVEGVGDVPVEVIAFKKGEGRSFLTPATAILFTVNGQVHGGLGRRFCSREPVGLDFLKNDLMVVLNCTEISARVREDLFMPSRDRLRECHVKRAFEQALEAYLGDHAVLSRLNLERREAELRDRLADDKPLTEALKSIIDSSPELKALFRLGTHVASATVPGEREDEFTGTTYPTFFRLVRREESVAFPTYDCAPTRGSRIHFETDAVNDYFNRLKDPGTLTVTPPVLFDRVTLHNGKSTLVLKYPPRTMIGDEVEVLVEVSDSQQQSPFVNRFQLRMVGDAPPGRSHDHTPPPTKTGGLALPKVVEVDEDDWASEEFGPESGLTIQRDVDGGLVAKVNVANEHLKQFLLRNAKAEIDLMQKRFVYGLVLVGVSLWQEYHDDEKCDELIRSTSSAVARVLLPTIVVLGSLDVPSLVPS